MENKDKIIEKLRKIKELAERGVGGEKQTAMEMYDKLLEKYNLHCYDIEEEETHRHWFKYDGTAEKFLIMYVGYKVTGSPVYYIKTDPQLHMVGFELTDFEKDEFHFYFRFYVEHLRKEEELFAKAFCIKNMIFPDETARLYGKDDDDDERKPSEMSEKDRFKMSQYAQSIDFNSPHIGIEIKE